MLKIYHLFLISLFIVQLVAISKRPDPAIVNNIQKVYNLTWYSGYLNIPDIELNNVVHHMHYFYFPSQTNTTENTDPLLFWFNGGPGCSSLLGALYEHGPFLLNDAFGILMKNQYSWNKKANVVYIESPSEVGFSYIDNKPANYAWNDDAVAILNRDALLEFLQVWPEFKGRRTFLSGESYAGIYVPTLFEKLHDYNQNKADNEKVKIQGFAVGNGCTHISECQFLNDDYSPFLIQLYRDIGVISQDFYKDIISECKNQQNLTVKCIEYLNETDKMVIGLNVYDAFRPCYENNRFSTQQIPSFSQLKRLALRKRTAKNKTLSSAPPCVDSLGIDNILKDKDIRANLSIPSFVQNYSMCNDNDDFIYNRSTTGSYHIYKRLIPLNKYKIIKYSGDSDPAVPTSGTLSWVNMIRKELQLSTSRYWRPWFTTKAKAGPQNSGNVWEFTNNFKLITFKGIGHMVPQWNLQGGQKMIHNLLWEELI